MKRVYLAGPDVFFKDPVAIGERLKGLCAAYGLEGVFPLDAAVDTTLSPRKVATQIFEGNRNLIDSCDGVLAHLVPFRGPSADVGTVWELGYALGRGKKVAGYTGNLNLYHDKARGLDEHMVESFELFDNLMVACSCRTYFNPQAALTDLAAQLRGEA